jgi:tetratricopeptide (TPR) repeat protein
VGAYFATFVITERSLPPTWLGPLPKPVELLFEQGGAGDDIRVGLAGGKAIEVQAKRGLTKAQILGECIARFVEQLQSNEFALLVVDRTTSQRFSNRLRLALRRWSDGMELVVDPDLEDHVAPLRTPRGKELKGRIAIVELEVADHDSPGTQVAVLMLEASVGQDANAVFRLLAEDSHQAAALGTRRDRHVYERELNAAGYAMTRPISVAARPGSIASPAVGGPSELPPELQAVNRLLQFHQPRAALQLLDAIRVEGDALAEARTETGRASALLQLGRTTDARKHLEIALAAKPDYAAAMVRFIACCEMDGDRDAAANLARQLVDRAPAEASSWATVIHYDDRFDVGEVPPEFADEPDVLTALAVRRMRAGEAIAAVDLLGSAGAEAIDNLDRRFLLGQALYCAAEQDPMRATELQRRALDAFASVADALSDADSTLRDSATAFAARIADEMELHDEAQRWLEKALRLPRARRTALIQLAQRDMGRGESQRALERLGELGEARSDPVLLSLRARARAAIGERDMAEDDLRLALDAFSSLAGDEPMETAIALANACLELEQPLAGLEALRQADNEKLELRVVVLRARALAAAGEIDQARGEYQRALLLAPPAIASKLRYEFARHLVRAGDAPGAIAILRVDRAPELAEFLAWLYLREGENLAAERLAREQTDHDTGPAWAFRTMAQVASARGDDEGAVEWLRQWALADTGPDAVINYGAMLARLGRPAEAVDVLRSIAANELPPTSRLQFAGLLARLGEAARALDVGYSALHEAPHDDEVQLYWIQLTVLREVSVDEPEPEYVAPGVFAMLDFGTGQKRGILVADTTTVQPALGEIPPDHELAVAVLGRRVGDVVELRSEPVTLQVEIVDLKHKYVHAAQWAMEEYSSLHPTSPSFQTIKVIDDAGEHDFSALFAYVEDRQERLDALRTIYDDHRNAPVGMFANAIGETAIEAYDLMWHRDRPRVWVSAPEYGPLVHDVPERIVLSATALRTVQVLRITNVLELLDVEFIITPALRDWLRGERERLVQASDRGFRSIGFDPSVARPTAYEAHPEEVMAALREHERLCEWIQQNTNLVPRPHDWQRERTGDWARVDLWSYEAALIARESDAVLFADDLGHRMLSWRAWRVPSLHCFEVLSMALAAGRLSEADFNRAVRKLHVLGHRFVPLSIAQVRDCLSQSDGRLSLEFERLLLHIRDRRVTEDSAARIVAHALRELNFMRNGPVTAETMEATLEAYFAERKRGRARRYLHRAIETAFALLPLDRDRIAAMVDAFLRVRL